MEIEGGRFFMLECDITYDIDKLEEILEEERIIEFSEFIIKDEYGKEYEENDYYLSLLITDNKVIRQINKDYRDKDYATDVISFAYNETDNIGPVNIIGDIVVSLEKVKEQAQEYGHSEEREFYYVLCHGILHLLGYDHMNEEERKIMRKREEEILEKFNYKRS